MARRAMRNFSPLKIYRLYTIGAYLDVRASPRGGETRGFG